MREPDAQGAQTAMPRLSSDNSYAFDWACRVKAIQLASRPGSAATGAMFSINSLLNGVYEPTACIELTLATARATGFPPTGCCSSSPGTSGCFTATSAKS